MKFCRIIIIIYVVSIFIIKRCYKHFLILTVFKSVMHPNQVPEGPPISREITNLKWDLDFTFIFRNGCCYFTTRNLYKIITIPNLNIFGCLDLIFKQFKIRE